ncbi:MAG TPA: tetratricopeptide repeat protein [Gemmatimonas sp.]|nr:tetratricopeptide repeat protein [Gemmatimonas sp.]
MSNAAKLRKKAAELEGLKQYDRAIAVYASAIERSENDGEEVDVALLNKVGDLTLRQGRVSDAVTYYERAVEHYATVGLFNNAIALCNKILRNAPGRSNVYFTLGRICARKGLRTDATRNFLEYATRMQQEGRVDEGMRALAEVADLMPDLIEIRRLVDEHAARAGITMSRRRTPASSVALPEPTSNGDGNQKSPDLVFLDLDMPSSQGARVLTPLDVPAVVPLSTPVSTPASITPTGKPPTLNASLGAFLLFDPTVDDVSLPQVVEESAELEPTPLPAETEDLAEVAEVVATGAHPAVAPDESIVEMVTVSVPPFRLDPHNFILPGELPPLLLSDEVVALGLDRGTWVAPTRLVYATPSIPIASVAAEASVVAVSRRDALRLAVADTPRDWMLRQRLAEALFEAGEREAALAELETAVAGHVDDGQVAEAADLTDVLVRVAGDRIQYHQKRVELAVRMQDQGRLRLAYLDLGDGLLQTGDDVRARAVYARVLEMDPMDDRARSALGVAAPPPPVADTAVDRPDDAHVDLVDWLRDDNEPMSTRMRMREPEVSGDEQADFDALLRHFKEGVARSLGEEDYESHYDLGVAFKEMGLLDDAIGEFQKALRSRSHRLPAYEALGQCFVEQERYQVAATVLSRALHEPGLSDDQRVGVIYLLAYSSEALQRWDEARGYYQRVYATDINFRDAAARLAALGQVAR